MNPDQIIALIRKEVERVIDKGEFQTIHPSQLTEKLIKQRNIDGLIIMSGSGNRPTNGDTGIKAHFDTGTGVLSIWDNTQWLETTLT